MRLQWRTCLRTALAAVLVLLMMCVTAAAANPQGVAVFEKTEYSTLHAAVEAARNSQTKNPKITVQAPVELGKNGEPATSIRLDVPGLEIYHASGADLMAGGVPAYEIAAPGVIIAGYDKDGVPGRLYGTSEDGVVHVLSGGSLVDCSISVTANDNGVAMVVDQGGSVILPEYNKRQGTLGCELRSAQKYALVVRGVFSAKEVYVSNTVLVDGGVFTLLDPENQSGGTRNHLSGDPCAELRGGQAAIFGARLSSRNGGLDLVDNRAVKSAVAYGGEYSCPFDGSEGSNAPHLLGENCTVTKKNERSYLVENNASALVLVGGRGYAYESFAQTLDGMNQLAEQFPGELMTVELKADVSAAARQSLPTLNAGKAVVNMNDHVIGGDGIPAMCVAGGQVTFVYNEYRVHAPCIQVTGGSVHAEDLDKNSVINGDGAVYLWSWRPQVQRPECGILYRNCSNPDGVDYGDPQYESGFGTVYGNPNLTDFQKPARGGLGTALDEYVTISPNDTQYVYGDSFQGAELVVNKTAIQGTLKDISWGYVNSMQYGDNQIKATASQSSNDWINDGSKVFTIHAGKRPLTFMPNQYLSLEKVFDGTAQVSRGYFQSSYGSLTGYADSISSNNRLTEDDYTISANYDTPDVGTGKTVTFQVELKDNERTRCYTVPENTCTVNTGVITARKLDAQVRLHIQSNRAKTYTLDLREAFGKLGNPGLEQAVFTYTPKQSNSSFYDGSEITVQDGIMTIPIKSASAGDGSFVGTLNLTMTAPNYAQSNPSVALVAHDKQYVTLEGIKPVERVTYNGQPQKGYTGVPVDYTGELEVKYQTGFNQISDVPPTNAGSYSVTVSVPESDPVYCGSMTFELYIDKAVRPADSFLISGIPEQIMVGTEFDLAVENPPEDGKVSWYSPYSALTVDAQTGHVKVNDHFGTKAVTMNVSGSTNYKDYKQAVQLVEYLPLQPELRIEGLPEQAMVGDTITLNAVGGAQASTNYTWTVTGGGELGYHYDERCDVHVKSTQPVTVTVTKKVYGFQDATASVTFTPKAVFTQPEEVSVKQNEGVVRLPVKDFVKSGTCVVAAYDENDRLIHVGAADFVETRAGYLEVKLDLSSYAKLKIFALDVKNAPAYEAVSIAQ